MTHKWCNAPLDFAYTGYYSYFSSNLSNPMEGYAWSRTARNSSETYSLYFDVREIYPQTSNYRGNGYPLRCTAK